MDDNTDLYGWRTDCPEGAQIIDLSHRYLYDKVHLPGAIWCDKSHLFQVGAHAQGLLPTVHDSLALFKTLGLTSHRPFLLYDDQFNQSAARLAWLLQAFGQKNIYLLDGGLKGWLQAKKPLSRDVPQVTATDLSWTFNPNFVADKTQVEHAISNQSADFWDSRTPEEYQGQQVRSAHGGHLPGAIHCEFSEVLNSEGYFLPRPELERLLKEKGFDKSKPIMTYCHSHYRAGLPYWVATSLGYQVLGYAGSWSEWGNIDSHFSHQGS